ncbi:MAG: ABC transporter ATP-binding protein [Armatimonadota bacterium]|nr:ABC transporter ATP-binding protein [Armatimonadota bacterium]
MPAGQRVAVVGPNGAGKTTLIRTLLALAPFSGTATIGGFDTRREGWRARALVGYVPQSPSFPGALTAAEVISLFQELRGLPAAPLTLLQTVGLEDAADSPVRTLSGGMVRRLALAVACIGNPPVWLLDEPTSQLDAAGERLVLEWLEAAGREGKTILLATHHLDGLGAVVDRVVLLEEGRIAAAAEVSALYARRWVEVVTVPPMPAGLPAAVRVLATSNGRLRLQVPDAVLAEAVRTLGGRPLRIHEPRLEDILRQPDLLREGLPREGHT